MDSVFFPRPQLGWAAATSECSRYPGEEGGEVSVYSSGTPVQSVRHLDTHHYVSSCWLVLLKSC